MQLQITAANTIPAKCHFASNRQRTTILLAIEIINSNSAFIDY